MKTEGGGVITIPKSLLKHDSGKIRPSQNKMDAMYILLQTYFQAKHAEEWKRKQKLWPCSESLTLFCSYNSATIDTYYIVYIRVSGTYEL